MLDQQASFKYTALVGLFVCLIFFPLQLFLEYRNQIERVKDEIRSTEGMWKVLCDVIR